MRRLGWEHLTGSERLAGAALVALGFALLSTSWASAGFALVGGVVGGGSVVSAWRELYGRKADS